MVCAAKATSLLLCEIFCLAADSGYLGEKCFGYIVCQVGRTLRGFHPGGENVCTCLLLIWPLLPRLNCIIKRRILSLVHITLQIVQHLSLLFLTVCVAGLCSALELSSIFLSSSSDHWRISTMLASSLQRFARPPCSADIIDAHHCRRTCWQCT